MLVLSKVLQLTELEMILAQVIYVYPEVGKVGPVPFTTTLLVPVVQSKHLIPLRVVNVALLVRVLLYEPAKSNTVVPDPG